MYTLGRKLRFSLFGRSHARCVGCILEGVPAGFPIDVGAIGEEMALRRPRPGIGTGRAEADGVEFVEGVVDGRAVGTPIIMEIANGDADGSGYLAFSRTPRPGHADLPALVKYGGFDIAGGGQFSGRLTAPIVAAGGIAKQMLAREGVRVAAFCRSVGGVEDRGERGLEDAVASRAYPTRACTAELDREFSDCISSAGEDGDSVGGVVECVIGGLPIGFGGIWFESLDAELAAAMFGIPACKGVEFGRGFALAGMRGSQSNDAYRFEGGRVVTETNNMGGILGGMADGAPVVFRTAFKPTPSIAKRQRTVDLHSLEDADVGIGGRHDPCVAPRAAAVAEAAAALVVADQMERGF